MTESTQESRPSSESLPIARPITKSEVRILRPDEYRMLWEGSRMPSNQVQIDTLLFTGMRYIEAKRFHDHREWFDARGFVFLPKEATLKAKRKQLERWVKLNKKGLGVIPEFLQGKQLPTWQTFNENLKRWAQWGNLDPQGLCPKTMRKTWESWLMVTYPERFFEICLSQGHSSTTSLSHYLNLPFLSQDKEGMKPYVEGFF